MIPDAVKVPETVPEDVAGEQGTTPASRESSRAPTPALQPEPEPEPAAEREPIPPRSPSRSPPPNASPIPPRSPSPSPSPCPRWRRHGGRPRGDRVLRPGGRRGASATTRPRPRRRLPRPQPRRMPYPRTRQGPGMSLLLLRRRRRPWTCRRSSRLPRDGGGVATRSPAASTAADALRLRGGRRRRRRVGVGPRQRGGARRGFSRPTFLLRPTSRGTRAGLFLRAVARGEPRG